jgi:hypothetical protein
MNHKKAIPANGMRFTASATFRELVWSHEPGSCGSVGIDARNSQKTMTSRTEKSIPAIAAALGVFRFE